jgi:hypothetical protein
VTTIQRVLVSQSGASGPTSGMTAQGSIFNGFEFSLVILGIKPDVIH